MQDDVVFERILNQKLTVGELKPGDLFILFPEPGDNSGHGGYLRAHTVCFAASRRLRIR